MKALGIILMLWAGCVAASAQASFTQRLQQSKQGEGKVAVTQDKTIDDLVNGPKVTASPQNVPQQSQAQKQKTQQQQTQQKSEKDSVHKSDSNESQRPVVATTHKPDTTIIPPDDGRKKIMKGYKVNGYRVQVYAGSGSRDSRVQAERTGKEINALFPGTPVYVHFYSPRWICRMGNYRTYEEASETLRAVRKLGYSSAMIVKGKITVPYLPTEQQATTP